jgi:hypothetical protein
MQYPVIINFKGDQPPFGDDVVVLEKVIKAFGE